MLIRYSISEICTVQYSIKYCGVQYSNASSPESTGLCGTIQNCCKGDFGFLLTIMVYCGTSFAFISWALKAVSERHMP